MSSLETECRLHETFTVFIILISMILEGFVTTNRPTERKPKSKTVVFTRKYCETLIHMQFLKPNYNCNIVIHVLATRRCL